MKQLDLFTHAPSGPVLVGTVPVAVSRAARYYAYHLARRLGWRWRLNVLHVPLEYYVWLQQVRLSRDARTMWAATVLSQDVTRAYLLTHNPSDQ